jgi:hypothetical protein
MLRSPQQTDGLRSFALREAGCVVPFLKNGIVGECGSRPATFREADFSGLEAVLSALDKVKIQFIKRDSNPDDN